MNLSRHGRDEHQRTTLRDVWYVALGSFAVVCSVVIVAIGVADAQSVDPTLSTPPPESAAPEPAPVPPPTPPSDDGWLLYQLPGAIAADAFESAGVRVANRPCPENVLEEARQHLHAKDLEGARALLVTAADCRELSVREAFLLAHVALELDAPETALRALDVLPDDFPLRDFSHVYRGRALALMGTFEQAAAAFAEVTEDIRGPLYHTARVEEAISLAAAGPSQAAEEALSGALDDFPEYPMRERIFLQRGLVRKELGNARGAANDFETVVFAWPWKNAAVAAASELEKLVAEGVHVRTRSFDERYERARTLRIDKHWDIAEAAFRELLAEVATESGNSEAENRLKMQIALNFYGASRYDDAIPILEHLAELHEKRRGRGTSRDAVYTLLMRCHAYSGRFEKALAALQERDKKRGELSQHRRLADFFEMTGQYEKALRHWDQVLNSSSKRSWHYAFLLYKVERYRPAIRLLRSLARASGGRTRAKYLYWMGRAQMKRGELENADDTFATVAERYPRSYYGIQAANRRLEIEHHEERLLVEKLAPKPPGPTLGRVAERVATGSESDEGVGADDDSVKRTLGPLDRAFATTPSRHAAGGSHEVAGAVRVLPSTPALQDPGEMPPPKIDSAPATISWDRTPFVSERYEDWKEDVGSDVEGELHPYLAAYLDSDSVDSALAKAAESYGDLFPRLVRASFLYDVGLETEARWELRDVALEFRGLRKLARSGRRPRANSPWALGFKLYAHYIDNRSHEKGFWGMRSRMRRYMVPSGATAKRELAARQRAIVDKGDEIEPLLIAALKEGGDYHLVRRYAHADSFTKTDPLNGPKRNRWSEAFPRAFPRLVQQHADIEGMDPYLMWALMTVESSYNPDSVSTANARGLLQVIPRTGIKVATTLKVDEYGPHDLLDERMSIRFGTWYFGQLMHKFYEQPLLAFAGYNGGPHNVARWLTMRGRALEMDEFVETIPFDQARGYSKKVFKFASLYQRIYERNPTAYIGNDLRWDFKEHPNY